MKRIAAVFLLSALNVGYAAAQADKRELGAHVHGKGNLAIAIEGSTVTMRLDIPGHDIVGFEHAPTTDEQKAAFETATQALKDGLALFGPTAAANCKLVDAKVDIEADDKDAKPDASKNEGESKHSDFNADYKFECGAVNRLSALTMTFFQRFKNAEALDVTIVTAKGQTTAGVTKARPVLNLAGMI
jgi:hypothetical protein